jgi:hypothetical protein
MNVSSFQIQGNPQDITTLKWVYVMPTKISVATRTETRRAMYETFYRLMFLTKRKVWLKTKKSKREERVILVPSPHGLSDCDRMFLKKKGFPIKTEGCSRDSCFRCRSNGFRL